jgi:hypothetical protein
MKSDHPAYTHWMDAKSRGRPFPRLFACHDDLPKVQNSYDSSKRPAIANTIVLVITQGPKEADVMLGSISDAT